MEETDEGAAPEGTTLAGTPNVAPAGDDGGAYGQPEVQYAKRSVVPVIIGTPKCPKFWLFYALYLWVLCWELLMSLCLQYPVWVFMPAYS